MLGVILRGAVVTCSVALGARGADLKIELLYGNDEIFPSALISVTDQSPFPPQLIDQLGDPRGLISVTVTAPQNDCPVKITLAATELFGESSISLTLPQQGQRYRIAPYLVLDHAKIMRLKHPIPAEVLRAKVELGQKVLSITRRVRIHAINDCLIAADVGDKLIDAAYLGAAFVNENNPELPPLVIRHALDKRINRFVGYEGGMAAVEKEVEAIYGALQDMGFKYAAMLQSSVASERVNSYDAASQWIRLSSDSIRSDQANCIDGTVILASVLTRLRLRVVLFVVPQKHTFMGVWLRAHDQTLDSVLAIETTLLGSAPFADARLAGARLLASYVSDRAKVSGKTVRFLSELLPGDAEPLQNKAGANPDQPTDRPSLYVVDIQDARLKRGIQPVAELMPGSRWVMPGSRWVIPLPSAPR